jgi:hypothetical protein
MYIYWDSLAFLISLYHKKIKITKITSSLQ